MDKEYELMIQSVSKIKISSLSVARECKFEKQ